jgi:magnesium transporter
MGTETQNIESVRQQKHGAVTWADVHRPSAEVFEQLKRDYQLHPLHLNESIQKVQHTQVGREDDYLFLVLHFPIFDARRHKIFIRQVGIFLGKNYLITIHASECPVIDQLFTACMHNTAHAEEQFKDGSDYLLYIFISKLLSNISEMTDVVVSELDGIEDLVFGNTGSDAPRIGKVRQKIVRLRRVIGPKRLILEDLAQQIDSFTGRDMSKYYDNNTKTANKLWEVIEEAKETVEIYKDADFIASTEKTNKILMILTLAFTFTIPVTVAGTLYGMNVNLPGGIQTGPWMFLGTYTSFGLIAGLSMLFAIGMYVYLKRKKWF